MWRNYYRNVDSQCARRDHGMKLGDRRVKFCRKRPSSSHRSCIQIGEPRGNACDASCRHPVRLAYCKSGGVEGIFWLILRVFMKFLGFLKNL